MKREIKIGLTVMLALLLLYLVLAWINGSNIYPSNSISYRIHFSNISGLLEGDPVHYRGYTIGNVTKITPQSDHIEVIIQIQREIPLFADAYAEIQPKELMGGKQIQLVQGAQNNTRLSNQELPGYAALDFSSGFSRMGNVLKQVESIELQAMILQLDSLFHQTHQIMLALDPQTLQNTTYLLNENLVYLNTILSEVQNNRLISNLDSTIQNVNQLTVEGNQMMMSVQETLSTVDTALIPNLVAVTDTLPLLLSQTRRLMSSTQQVIENEHGFIGQMLNDTTLFTKVDSSLILLNQVLRQIQEDKIIVGFKRRK